MSMQSGRRRLVAAWHRELATSQFCRNYRATDEQTDRQTDRHNAQCRCSCAAYQHWRITLFLCLSVSVIGCRFKLLRVNKTPSINYSSTSASHRRWQSASLLLCLSPYPSFHLCSLDLRYYSTLWTSFHGFLKALGALGLRTKSERLNRNSV